MRHIYLSFLGLGTFNRETGKFGYIETVYELEGKASERTPLVQVAEIAILGPNRFDAVVIVTTPKARETHGETLDQKMAGMGVTPRWVLIDEDFSAEGQWRWFEQILSVIEPGDRLTVDMTHGYRAFSLILATALNFIQKARNVQLDAVYYGAYDSNRKLSPIVDLRDFYLINEWADAVGRLVDDADARKLGETAIRTSTFQAGELNDPEVIDAFKALTETIRNVDVNNVADRANTALDLIEKKRRTASPTARMLLGLVIDKFVNLSTGEPPSGRYDRAYFAVQVEIIRMLLEHRLFMQAYTVMREMVASLAMIPFEREGMKSKKRKTRRPKYGEIFVHMLHFDRSEWDFEGREDAVDRLLPFYGELERADIEPILRSFTKELADYRNGFDHAWTKKAGALPDIDRKGETFFDKLKTVLQRLDEARIWETAAHEEGNPE